MHLQRNATQRIPQLYLLTNNLNFYILQIFETLNFLGVRFVLQNIFSSLRRKVKKLIKNDISEEEILNLL